MRRYLLVLMLAWLHTTALANSDTPATTDAPKDNPKVYAIYEGVTLVPTIKFQYERPRIVVKALYPQLVSDTPNDSVDAFNQLVTDLVQQTIVEYKQQVVEKTLEPKTSRKNDLYIDFDTSFIQSGKQPIISIRFSVQGYLPGVTRPFHHHFVLNYDLNDNEQIDLDDLFVDGTDYLTILSSYTGDTPTPEAFKNWNIKPNGLLITLDSSAKTILVPYTALKPLIDPDAPIAHCVANKKRCLRSNLLTGGFIDTANNSRRTINTHHRILNPTLSQR